MKKIIILTASIPRPELHKISLTSFYENILMNDEYKNYELIHIINIDSPEKIIDINNNSTICINNFDEIIPNFVKKIYIDKKKANFSEAYKSLFLKANEFVVEDEDCYIIWLEDDWFIKKNFPKFPF